MKHTTRNVARRCVFLAWAAALAAGCAGGAFQARPEDIPLLEQQLAASPQDETVQRQLGIAYFQAGRYPDALARLAPLAAAGTTESTAWLYLGLTQEKLEAWSEAREAYSRYLELGASEQTRSDVRDRLALVARRELRQQARVALEREQQLAQQPPTPNSIAVLPFGATGLPEELAPLRTALAEMIVTDLGFTQLRALERVRVQTMLDEMRLGLGGVAEEETSARVGRLLRAQHVVQGQLTGLEDRQLAIAASVLDVARRTPGDELSRRGELEALFDLEKQLVFGILEAVQYPLSPGERERIEENRVANLIAFLAYGRGLEALDRGDYTQARDLFQQARRADPGFGAAQAQQTTATELSQAETGSAEQVGESGMAEAAPVAPVSTTVLTQQVLNEVNPSPAPAVVQQTSGTTAQGGQTVKERSAPTTEPQQQPPLSQATKATIIILIKRPGG